MTVKKCINCKHCKKGGLTGWICKKKNINLFFDAYEEDCYEWNGKRELKK